MKGNDMSIDDNSNDDARETLEAKNGENEEEKTKADFMFESLEKEIGIPRICVIMLSLSYEKLSGTKFQDEDEPTEAEFSTFRTYTINNYKKMRQDMGYKILTAEGNGINYFSGTSFNGSIGENVYRRIEEWAIANGAQKQGGCYVATAVYGSYDCPQVWVLRRYRDNWLNGSLFGRIFIKCYYAISPTLIRAFGKRQWFNRISKAMLDKFVEILANKGVSDKPYRD
jgi:hypothetical protein